MRYKSWDVVLLPQTADIELIRQAPIPEFATQCISVPEQDAVDMAIFHCWVPSMEPGALFRVALRQQLSWPFSQLARSCASNTDSLQIEARVFIDGDIAASCFIDASGKHPIVIGGPHGEALHYPPFHALCFSPRDRDCTFGLGHIRVILSEGLTATSRTPFVRLRNIAMFAFQHAPFTLLHNLGISDLKFGTDLCVKSHRKSANGCFCYQRHCRHRHRRPHGSSAASRSGRIWENGHFSWLEGREMCQGGGNNVDNSEASATLTTS